MIPLGKYQRTGKLIWTTESSAAFKLCQQAISNCQELYFLEDTPAPILQTDASDYGIGGYLYMVTNDRCILEVGRIIPHQDYGCVRG